MAEGTMGVVLGPDLDVAVQLRWAVRLAEARSLDLLILQHVESREGKTVEISLGEAPDEKMTPVAKQVREMIEPRPVYAWPVMRTPPTQPARRPELSR